MSGRNRASLRLRLEEIESQYVIEKEIANDPVALALRFESREDQEVAAFISAVFSYGNVKQIQTSLKWIFAIIGENPARALRESRGNDWKKKIPPAFRHRFNSATDLGILLTWLGEVLRRSGSIEGFFTENSSKDDLFKIRVEKFATAFLSLPCSPFKIPETGGPRFFLPKPSGKSACKRLLLFLRWMVGTSDHDLGLWTQITKRDLMIPVDTHVLRISHHLGLTKRKDNSWRTAEEITESLKKLDPEDPTRFDFALCHIGISRECPSRVDLKICSKCRMNDLCLTYSRKPRNRL